MSWIDKLQPASFRGVAFYVEPSGTSAEIGRRAFSVEYPYRDEPFVDDMGRRLRKYNIPAFILEKEDGPNLYEQRTALFEALEAYGPATLIHPRLGALRVQVAEPAQWTTSSQGNVERFAISFIEAAAEAQPQVTTNTLDEVIVTAARINSAQASYLDRVMSIKNQADFVVQGARDAINNGMTGVKKLVRIGTAAADSVSSLTQTIDSAINDVSNLILLPRTLAATVSTIIQQALGIDDRIDTALAGYRAIDAMWAQVEPIPQTTPSRITQANNQAAIAQLFITSATVAAARIVAQQASALAVTSNSDSPFDSADQAYAIRDELVSALDAIALTADAELYNTLVDLQAALVAHIAAHGNTLPRVSRVTFAASLPMLVIAHRLHGNIDRETDLIARNRIKHPLFVPQGRELEVLNG